MSDPEEPAESPAPAPAPKKPPTALVVAALGVVTLIAGVAVMRGRTNTSSSLQGPGPSAPAGPTNDPSPPRPSGDGGAENRPAALADSVGQASPGVLSLFAPLRPGATIGQGRVERISDVVDGRILIAVRFGERLVEYGVMLQSSASNNLIRGGPFVVYIHGQPASGIQDAAPLIATALSNNIEAGVHVPDGLQGFSFERDRRPENEPPPPTPPPASAVDSSVVPTNTALVAQPAAGAVVPTETARVAPAFDGAAPPTETARVAPITDGAVTPTETAGLRDR